MKRLLSTLFLIFNILLSFSQNGDGLLHFTGELNELTFEYNVSKDSLDLWEYKFVDIKDDKDGKLGEVLFKRKTFVKDSLTNDSLIPKILFYIYPISQLDSISQFADSRRMMLSCCYPKCGATIIKTKNYVFYSSPFSIESAFNCSGIDYTRWNVKNILNPFKNKEYTTISELLKDIPIGNNKSLKWNTN